MSQILAKRLFKNVDANTTETLDYIPANNEELKVNVCYGQAASIPDTMVAIIWDEPTANDVLFCTNSTFKDDLVDFTVTGDGVKKLVIKLVNNTNSSTFLGGGWTE